MPATVIVGAQWGDEGKGKIVDLLAQHSDLVCRYQGGPNAGHTIVAEGEKYKFHHMPSGILHGKECILGAGCVIDPEVFVAELDELEARGISTGCVRVSGEAHLIMPWHVAIDQGSERRLGELQIGTTKRGIGPAYADKAARLGIRVQDLLEPKILRQKIEVALAEKNVWLERVYGAEPLELEELAARYEVFAQRLRPYVADTSLLVDRALREGRFVLLEGAQGTLLDLDHGTYPFVTSSGTVAGAAAVGVGIGPNRIDAIIGVAKAYVTRVGEGPVPDRDRRRRPGTRARPGRRVRHDDRPPASLRLARPGRPALRGAPERDHLARVDEARRAFARSPSCRSACATGCETARRPPTSRRTRATSTTAGRSSRRCRAGRSRSTR